MHTEAVNGQIHVGFIKRLNIIFNSKAFPSLSLTTSRMRFPRGGDFQKPKTKPSLPSSFQAKHETALIFLETEPCALIEQNSGRTLGFEYEIKWRSGGIGAQKVGAMAPWSLSYKPVTNSKWNGEMIWVTYRRRWSRRRRQRNSGMLWFVNSFLMFFFFLSPLRVMRFLWLCTKWLGLALVVSELQGEALSNNEGKQALKWGSEREKRVWFVSGVVMLNWDDEVYL